jgi:squalene-hopene/tetraprenyl-beta-curcumene cyclase
MDKLKSLIDSEKNKIKKLLKNQKSFKAKDGYFIYELEADVTIPSEYILLMHFLGKIDLKLEKKVTNYIISRQNKEGGWPLFYNGETDLSASVKAYYALKLSGLSENSLVLSKAKKCIIEKGGANSVNVFTKISLALFNQIPWESVPFMPIEIIKFPKWFPFHIYKISYWSRTVLIPLLIIMHEKPVASNPNAIDIDELFTNEIVKAKSEKSTSQSLLSVLFLFLETVSRLLFPLLPTSVKEKSKDDIINWLLPRLNGEDGLGGIFPAMVNALIALKTVDENKYKNQILTIKKSIDNLVVEKKDSAYCQPCVSPIWDTGWMGLVNLENNIPSDDIANWFLKKEIKIKGDWAEERNLDPAGWAFQYNNAYYPDVDDTALVGMFLDRYNKQKNRNDVKECIFRTKNWIIGMQSKNGGWGAFDINNTRNYLNYIPFADHGALLDPPTADVSARCLSFLLQLGDTNEQEYIRKAVKYLLNEQEKDGSWYGRWGTNYLYGTWSVLSALNLANFKNKNKVFFRSIKYLKEMQHDDGGWGEDGKSYYKNYESFSKKSTPSQTSWALMALHAAGEIECESFYRGVNYLVKNNHNFDEQYYTAVGFPKVFYLKYHGYAKYFPLLALAKIKNQISKNSIKPIYGV